jgi:hypothetical protein
MTYGGFNQGYGPGPEYPYYDNGGMPPEPERRGHPVLYALGASALAVVLIKTGVINVSALSPNANAAAPPAATTTTLPDRAPSDDTTSQQTDLQPTPAPSTVTVTVAPTVPTAPKPKPAPVLTQPKPAAKPRQPLPDPKPITPSRGFGFSPEGWASKKISGGVYTLKCVGYDDHGLDKRIDVNFTNMFGSTYKMPEYDVYIQGKPADTICADNIITVADQSALAQIFNKIGK